MLEKFRLDDRIAIITGGAGLLGIKHAEAIAEAGGIPVLLDIKKEEEIAEVAGNISRSHNTRAVGFHCDITKKSSILETFNKITEAFGRVDILINNAANDPKVNLDMSDDSHWSRAETFSIEQWNQDIAVGLTGAFLCSQILGQHMAKQGKGVILNIASDMAIIAPDQRIYRKPELPEEKQPVKPVSYSVVKAGLLGLTRYMATYWAEKGVRVNSLSPGGVYAGQDRDFTKRLCNLIPLGRMAEPDEYKAAVVFLVSDASSYMTGSNVVIDGGRTCW